MKALKKCNLITVKFRELDTLEGKAATVRTELVAAMLGHAAENVENPIDEVERLITLAKGIVAEDGYEAHHDPKNLWASCRNLLLANLMKDEQVDVKRKVDGEVVTEKAKVADVIAKGTKAVNTVASQLRAKAGASDGRAGNTRKPKAGGKPEKAAPEKKADSKAAAKAWLKAQLKNRSLSKDLIAAMLDLQEQLTEAAKWEGYTLSIAPTEAQAKATPKAKETQAQRKARLAEAAAASQAEIDAREAQLAK